MADEHKAERRRVGDASLGRHVYGGIQVKDVIWAFAIIVSGLTQYYSLVNKVDNNMTELRGKFELVQVQLDGDEEEDSSHLEHGHVDTKKSLSNVDTATQLIQKDVNTLNDAVNNAVEEAKTDRRETKTSVGQIEDDIQGVNRRLDRLFDLLDDRHQ